MNGFPPVKYDIEYYSLNDFKNLSKLAEGGEGIVYKGFGTTIKRSIKRKQYVAIKTFNRLDIYSEREIQLLRALTHRNIVEIFGGVREFVNKEPKYIGYVMELMELGSLDDIIHSASQQYGMRRIEKWITQIGLGLKYLHKNGIIHRDVKPKNILLAGEDHLKLADFGVARNITNNTFTKGVADSGAAGNMNNTHTAGIGTMTYMAPEVMLGERNYGPPADVYSFGITIWEIIHRKRPHGFVKLPMDSNKINSNQASFLISCSAATIQERPSIEEIIEYWTNISPTVVIFNSGNGGNKTAVLNQETPFWTISEFELPEDNDKISGAAVYCNGALYLIGGDRSHKKLFKLDENMEWTRQADMNEARHWIRNNCIVFENEIWVFGGRSPDGTWLKSVERYNCQEDEWITERYDESSQKLPCAVTGIVVNDEIIAMGKYIWNNSLKTKIFDGNKWDDGPSHTQEVWNSPFMAVIPQEMATEICHYRKPVQEQTSSIYNDNRNNERNLKKTIMLVLHDLQNPLHKIMILDRKKNKWKLAHKMDFTIYKHAQSGADGWITTNDEFYLVGGGKSRKNLFKISLPMAGQTKLICQRLANMNHGRECIRKSCVNLDGYIWVLGGYKDGCFLKSVERYDPGMDIWTIESDMKYARARAAAAVCNRKIIICGGMKAYSSYLNSVECLDPESGVWTELTPMDFSIFGHTLLHYQNRVIRVGGGKHSAVFQPINNNGRWIMLNRMEISDGYFALGLDDEIIFIGRKRNHYKPRLYKGRNSREANDSYSSPSSRHSPSITFFFFCCSVIRRRFCTQNFTFADFQNDLLINFEMCKSPNIPSLPLCIERMRYICTDLKLWLDHRAICPLPLLTSLLYGLSNMGGVLSSVKYTLDGIPYHTENDFKDLTRLGAGGYGIVHRCTVKGLTTQKRYVAVKLFNVMDIYSEREIQLLKIFAHPHIVEIYGVIWDGQRKDYLERPIYAGYVLEYMELGSLHNEIYDASKFYDMELIKTWIRQIGYGLQYLHGNGVIHRDINPHNILLAARDHIKLADFGLARSISTSCTSVRGTDPYMAPEVVSNNYGPAADVYSFGITIWEIIHRQLPMNYLKHSAGGQAIIELLMDPQKIDENSSNFLKKCWQTNSDSRPSIEEIIQFATIFKQTILIMKTSQDGNNIAILNRSTSTWAASELEGPFNDYGSGGALYCDGGLYLIGGDYSHKKLYKLEENMKWKRLTDMNRARLWIKNSCVVLNGEIWVLGGRSPNGNSVEGLVISAPLVGKWSGARPFK